MGLLNFRGKSARRAGREAEAGQAECCTVQTARHSTQPFKELDGYIPLSEPERRLYAAMREAVPVIDAAICKIVRLVGGFRVECADGRANGPLEHFLKTVPVGASGRGINAFTDIYLDQLITYGTAAGEMVPDARHTTVAALYNVPLGDIELKRGDSPLSVTVCRKENGHVCPVKYPELVIVSALSPDPGQIYGNSLLKSLPFVSSTLLKIFNTVGVNFERFGNLRYAVTYRPEAHLDRASAKNRAMQLAQEWSGVMQPGSVKDFVAVGDVQIKVIGADNQALDSSVPVRHMMEQIVAKTGIPPFMLGLNWSTSEKMSSQQADILTSELEAYRRLMEPVICRICGLWLRLNGFAGDVSVVWDNINLQDEVELARARLLNVQAREIEEKLEAVQ